MPRPRRSFPRRLALPRPPAPLAALLVASVLALSGCGASRPVTYHSLEPPHAAARDAAAPWNVSLVVGHINAPHVYREDRLVYRIGSSEIHAYESHRWVEPPTEILEHVLLQALRDSGRFRSVQAQRSSALGDFLLRGRLENFEEIKGSNAARILFEAELYDSKKGVTVWSQSFSQDEPVQGKGVDAVVDALQRATARAVGAVSAALIDYFSSHPVP